MRFGFREKKVDERVATLQNKIYRELYSLVVIICGISLVYKVFFAEAANPNIWTEVIILVGGAVYYLVRASALGIFSDEVEMHDRSSKLKLNTKKFMLALLVGIGISLIFATINSQLYGDSTDETIYFFFLILIACLLIYIPVLFGIMVLPYVVAKYKSDKVNEQQMEDLDDEDER
ncbi:hypothetical protein MUN89_21730 [Halobacillus salinarum]|uniref:DUF3278 domain-containing protein n=1 Tax=Halobacillus salinarum TaxID=2932257 RepID=A0ABY4EIV5_9BACI|nr:DUF6773 family protein [Halobacillus salinarum]UOQ44410.1 hypothetical protein MUN89_21730 [Halobacillus salinarum]